MVRERVRAPAHPNVVTRAGLVTALAAAVLACRTGVRVESFRPAQGPKGVRVEIETAGGSYTGELLEVRDAALLVLCDSLPRAKGKRASPQPRLALILLGAIRRGRIAQRSGLDIYDSQAPGLAERQQLRLLSRFPQGLTPELLERLLEQHAQTEPDLVR